MSSALTPVRLEGRTVHLVPLTSEHAQALHPLAEPEVLAPLIDRPLDPGFEAFAAYLRRLVEAPASLAFAIVLATTGEPAGTTSLMDLRPRDAGIEIGRTWIARAHQGTAVNPESKYLLLRHAFEALGLERVQLKTDLLNQRSQRAIEKLGAVREGVLRRYQRRADGTLRDTVVYSVIAADWPAVRAGLEARIGR